MVSGMGLAFVDLLVLLDRRAGAAVSRKRPTAAWSTCRPARNRGSGRVLGAGSPTTPRSPPPCAATRSAHPGSSPRPPFGVAGRARGAGFPRPALAADRQGRRLRLLPRALHGLPARVDVGWDEFSTRFGALDWYSPEREHLVLDQCRTPDSTWTSNRWTSRLQGSTLPGVHLAATMTYSAPWRRTSSTTSGSGPARTIRRRWPCSRPAPRLHGARPAGSAGAAQCEVPAGGARVVARLLQLRGFRPAAAPAAGGARSAPGRVAAVHRPGLESPPTSQRAVRGCFLPRRRGGGCRR